MLRGFVSKTGYSRLVMQSNAWFGASGSVVFDQFGRAVGVVHAISTELNPLTGMPVFIESVVIVNRVYDLTRKDILGILKNGKVDSRKPN